jgi:hypothetical protein
MLFMWLDLFNFSLAIGARKNSSLLTKKITRVKY